MTSLAAQLQAVASAVPREEKLKGKASLLYELREAADIDLATIYAVGVQGASPRPPAGEALPPPPLYARRHIPRMRARRRRRRRGVSERAAFVRADARSMRRGTPESEPRPSNDLLGGASRATSRCLPRRPSRLRRAKRLSTLTETKKNRQNETIILASLASRTRLPCRRFHRAVSVGRPLRGVPEAVVLARRVRDEPRAAGQGVQRQTERRSRGVPQTRLRALRDRRRRQVPGVPHKEVQNTRLQRRSRGDVRVAVPRHSRVRQARAAREPGGHVLLLARGRKGEGRRAAARRPRRAMRARRRVPELRVRSRSRQRQRKGKCAFFGFRFGRAARVEEAASSRAWFLFFSRRRRRSSTRRVPKGPPPFLPSDAAALVR